MCVLTHSSLYFRPDGVDDGRTRHPHDLFRRTTLLIAAPPTGLRNTDAFRRIANYAT